MNDIHSDLADVVSYLYARWQDEHKYEDFAEYVKHMQSKMPEGAKVTKMTKRPFKVEYTMADGARRWISATAGQVRWGSYITISQAWQKALKDAVFLIGIGLESKSALKQAGEKNGIAFGEDMGAFVNWAINKV